MAKRPSLSKKPKQEINRIKVVLVEEGVKQKELAQMIGISTNSVYRICKNEDQPSLQRLLQIAKALGVNIQRLLIPTEERDKRK